MKKVVILGCENSHANTFLNFIKEGAYPEIEIIGVYSEDTSAAEKLSEMFGVKVMSAFDEAAGEVDGVVVTARHGDNHYKYAKPYIKSGVAMFIDKPVTINEQEAVKFMQQLKCADVQVTGGSCCKYIDFIQELKGEHAQNKHGKTVGGFMRAPVSLNNDYGNFFFYSQHLVEMVCEVYGHYPLSVQAFVNNGKVTVVFRYENYDITALFVEDSNSYYAARYSEQGAAAKEINLTGESPCFRSEFDEFHKLLLGEKQKRSYKDFISPVFVLNAINRSITSGKEEKVTRYEV